MAKILSNAVTWIIVLLVVIIALLLGVVLDWWGGGDNSPNPTPSSSVSSIPSASPTVPSAFVERPVTVGPYVPDAQALTETILASAGSGWVVA
ncbi:MAG: hypothetical protein MUP36_03480, partial [Demequinaceae bacterium]|nr:hypothetical protein [Demequinaceae bacterium]